MYSPFQMKISRSHALGIDEAKARLDAVADEFGKNLSLTHQWCGDHLEFRGKGVDGKIGVTPSSIDIVVKLGFALLLFEPQIRRAIESALDHHIDPGTG